MVATRRRLHDPEADAAERAWRFARTPAERLAHLEELRAEYYRWGPDNPGPRIERVYRIVPLKG